jgi:hypothetical protein
MMFYMEGFTMGCDIHLHIEVMNNGKWEHWGAPAVPRCYALFAKLAGVRNYDDEYTPIAEPRGLPDHLSTLTKVAYEWEKGDAHDISWINRDEIDQVEEWIRLELSKTWTKDSWLCLEAHFVHSYCCGNGFAGIGNYDNSYPESITDVRFVFWFDC